MAESQVVEHASEGPVVHSAGLPAVSGPPGPQEWKALKEQAVVILKSGMAPRSVDTPEKILTIALKGRELAVPPMQALAHIHVVEGKPTMSAELMVALVQRAGHKLRVIETNDESCVVEGERRDDRKHPQRLEFTIEEARQAGVAGKQNWKRYPAAMLRARAISALCRFVFADVLMGASYTPEELGAEVDEEGRVVEAEDEPQKPASEARRAQGGQRTRSEGSATRKAGKDDSRASGEALKNGKSEYARPEQRRRITELAEEYFGEEGLRTLQTKVLKGRQIGRLSPENADELIGVLERKLDKKYGRESEEVVEVEGFDEDEVEIDESDVEDLQREMRGKAGASKAGGGQ